MINKIGKKGEFRWDFREILIFIDHKGQYFAITNGNLK